MPRRNFRPSTHLWRQLARGVAAVELAIVAAPMITLAFGATEYGRAIYTYNTLDKAVRDAARHLSQNGPGDAAVRAEALCLAKTGSMNCTSSTPLIAPGITDSNVQLCDAQNCASTHANQATGQGVISLVSVSIVNYRYTSFVTFVMPSLNFNGISTTMRAQL